MLSLSKYLFISLGMIFLLSGCSDKAQQINPVSNIDSSVFDKELIEQKAYEKAKKELKDKYIDEGFRNAQIVFEAFLQEQKSFKAGMYADKAKLLTNAKIVAYDTPNGVKIVSLGAEIRPEVSINDLMSFYAKHSELIPLLKQDMQRGKPFASYYGEEKSSETTIKSRVVKESNSSTQIVYKQFKKSYEFADTINEYGLSCQDRGGNYLCKFNNEKEYEYFCKQSGKCQ
jgi:hypothetical protein